MRQIKTDGFISTDPSLKVAPVVNKPLCTRCRGEMPDGYNPVSSPPYPVTLVIEALRKEIAGLRKEIRGVR